MGSESQLTAGEDLATYRIESLVGRGGMGEVYRAVDLRLGRPVALKILAPEIADDERLRERFLRESRLAASLDHPNVLPIYEAGEADGRLFIAMRFVDGTDLRLMLRGSSPLDSVRALALLAPVAGALDAAHARGLVHRDVKPANVLIGRGREPDSEDHVYLSDFGLTTLSSELGDAGAFTGTAAYAAPELVTGGKVDARSDVYALGCVLFECLTGEPPYRGDSVMGVLWGHVNDPVPSAAERNHALPEAVDAILRKALAKDPAKRPPSCRALVESARAALGLAERRGSRRLPVIAAVAAAAAAAALLTAIWLARDESIRGGVARSGGSIVRIDPATSKVLGSTPVGGRLTALAAGRDDVWAADAGASAVVRLDAATEAVRSSSSHGVPSDVAVAGSHAAVANGTDGTVAVYDAASGAFQGAIQLGGFGFSDASVATDGRWAWVASGRDLKRIDLVTLVRAGTSELPLQHDDELQGEVFVTDVATGDGSVWIAGDALNPTLWRVDPNGKRRTITIALPFGPDALTVADGAVWVANQIDDSVTRLDAASGRVGPTIAVGREPVALAAGGGAVWVANRLDGTVSRIDARTNRVTDTIAVGDAVEDVVVGAGAVWVAVGRS
jgi:YVTN family beta-propeller protein